MKLRCVPHHLAFQPLAIMCMMSSHVVHRAQPIIISYNQYRIGFIIGVNIDQFGFSDKGVYFRNLIALTAKLSTNAETKLVETRLKTFPIGGRELPLFSFRKAFRLHLLRRA